MSTTSSTKATGIANAFGALGYISVIFQWAWSILLLCYPLLVDRPEFLLPAETAPPQSQAFEIAPVFSPAVTIIAIAITVLILVATIIVLARLPRSIGKKAATLTKTAATAVLPAVTHHKKMSPTQRKKLSYNIILVIKLVAIIVPLLVLLFVTTDSTIPQIATWTVALFCALSSLVHFAIQQTIVLASKIDRGTVW